MAKLVLSNFSTVCLYFNVQCAEALRYIGYVPYIPKILQVLGYDNCFKRQFLWVLFFLQLFCDYKNAIQGQLKLFFIYFLDVHVAFLENILFWLDCNGAFADDKCSYLVLCAVIIPYLPFALRIVLDHGKRVREIGFIIAAEPLLKFGAFFKLL